MNGHAAPTPLLSPGPPINAVPAAVPDSAEESATVAPNLPGNLPSPGSSLTSPAPVSLDPCWVQVEPEPVYVHAAPTSLLSPGAPSSAVLAAPDEAEASATLAPNSPGCSSLLISSFSFFAFSGSASLACWVHISDELVNTHAAPVPLLSPGPPSSAVLPSPESATPAPRRPFPISPLAVSLAC